MAEITKPLTVVQFNILLELERELAQIEATAAQVRSKRATVYELLLESMNHHNASAVRFEAETRSVVITVADAPSVE